jgi:signal transduction histidine kinase
VVVDANERGGGDRVETLLRVNRRALAVLSLLTVFLGATAVAMALWPDIWLGQWPLRFPLLFPIAVLLAFFCLRFFGGGRDFRSDAAEVKVVLNDDFRRANLLRAQRIALGLILIAQVPLGLLFMHVQTTRAVIGMGGTTIAFGVSAVILLFLFFDRE